MSASVIAIGKQLTIYVGIPVCIIGIVGNTLNLFVFLSLKTFRQNSCAFYLIIMSAFNLGQLSFGFFSSRIINALIGVDGTTVSLFYCKFRVFLSHICVGTSLTCFCLATVDQFFATCSHLRWQQLSNIKLAYRLVIITLLFWMLHGISYIIFYELIYSITTNTVTCGSVNAIFTNYRNYFFIIVLTGYLPIIIAALFGYIAYRNIQQIAYRTIPLVRRELDKQLTTMVLIQVIVNVFTLLPYTTLNTIATNQRIMNDPTIQVQFQLVLNLFQIIYNIYFSSPFYIYICASERFRKQFVFVLPKFQFNQCYKPNITQNEITPEA